MRVRFLGWAGVEIESGGGAVVIDPLRDARAPFAPLGEAARRGRVPALVAPEPGRSAQAGLVTHLHRDHADAGALVSALADDASVYEPRGASGSDIENAALAQADAELSSAGLPRQVVGEWETRSVGPFELTALPAVDGLGDPQVSWLVEADDRRVVHLGDTVFHGYWWRMAQRHGPVDVVFVPINGAVVEFPHRQPPSPYAAALDPTQAALVGELLAAEVVVPMHYDGYCIDPWYRPVADAEGAFLGAAAGRPYETRVLRAGQGFEVP